MNAKYLWITGEPDLNDLLHDDVLRAVMERDGVTHQDLDALIARVQRRLNRKHEPNLQACRPTVSPDMASRAGI